MYLYLTNGCVNILLLTHLFPWRLKDTKVWKPVGKHCLSRDCLVTSVITSTHPESSKCIIGIDESKVMKRGIADVTCFSS